MGLGVAIMLSADAQKYFTLRQRRGLITDGLFARMRHPNYLGEMMVYAAYALLVRHPLPWAILGWIWLQIFGTNMVMVEASLARYPEWNAYRARTGMLLPRLWPPQTAATSAPALEASAPETTASIAIEPRDQLTVVSTGSVTRRSSCRNGAVAAIPAS
jgi:hypothetical protein